MRFPLVRSLALALLLALGAGASAQSPEDGVFPYEMRIEKLPNGLQVVVIPLQPSGLVAYYTLVRVGSRNEVEKGKSGFAHFFEHMMFRGTKKYPAEVRDAFLKRIGADDNGFTTDDFTCYTVFGANTQMDELVKIEADRFKNLEYSKTQFKTEAGAVLGEYNKNFSRPTEQMEEKLLAAAFTQHTYRHTTIGFKQDIEAMPKAYDYSRTFFKRWYTPDNTTLVIAGDVDPADTFALVKKHYSDWKGKVAAPKIHPEPPQTRERRVDMEWDTETAPRMLIAYHTPAQNLTNKDSAVQDVLGSLLLGGASDLHRELVLEKGLVEGFYNATYDHRDPHLFYFLVTLKEEKDRAEVLDAIEEEIAAVAAGKVDEKLLADVKSRAKYGVLTSLETPEDVASTIAVTAGPSGDPKAIEKLLAHLETVTAEDVAAFAKKYLVKENRTTVNLASKGDAK